MELTRRGLVVASVNLATLGGAIIVGARSVGIGLALASCHEDKQKDSFKFWTLWNHQRLSLPYHVHS